MNITAQTIIEQTEFLAKDYVVEGDQIKSPGKFEGEWTYSLYFYDCIMNGGGDEIIPSYLDSEKVIDVFYLTESEKDAFPILTNATKVHCITDDAGFFYCDAHV